jgi:hypothetical protein
MKQVEEACSIARQRLAGVVAVELIALAKQLSRIQLAAARSATMNVQVAWTALDCNAIASVFLTVVIAAHGSPDASNDSLYLGAMRVCPIKPNYVQPDCMSRTIVTHDGDTAAFTPLTPIVELDVNLW